MNILNKLLAAVMGATIGTGMSYGSVENASFESRPREILALNKADRATLYMEAGDCLTKGTLNPRKVRYLLSELDLQVDTRGRAANRKNRRRLEKALVNYDHDRLMEQNDEEDDDDFAPISENETKNLNNAFEIVFQYYGGKYLDVKRVNLILPYFGLYPDHSCSVYNKVSALSDALLIRFGKARYTLGSDYDKFTALRDCEKNMYKSKHLAIFGSRKIANSK